MRALVFVENLAEPVLEPDDRHHLERVLRLRAGESVVASDGRGQWRQCSLVAPGRLAVEGEIVATSPLLPPITVGFALTKGERPEWTVQKLVEAGVDCIIPMTTGRTIVRWEGEKAPRQVDRLRAVAKSAAMQSRQVRLPVVSEVTSFSGAAVGGACLAQMGGAPPSLERPVVLVGPEGGWDDDELALGLPAVGLGPTVLRAETAAMAAGVLLCALRAGVVR